MTGPEHYQEAEHLLELATEVEADKWHPVVARAQVHAMLAQAAATATGWIIGSGIDEPWLSLLTDSQTTPA